MGRKSSEEVTPPLVVIEGRQDPAVYLKQLVPEFVGNPLIEALPPLWPLEDVTELLSHYPPYSKDYRSLPAEVRLHMLDNAREFFIPQGIHLEIHISISNMLRRGYLARNPLDRGYWLEVNRKLESFREQTLRGKKLFLRAKARGFCIVGIGGIGKSTTVENILSLYPQVIVHTRYREQDFILKQLVWLKIQCPNDGSIKGLCLNFFGTVDAILGTNYAQNYGSRRRSVDELLPDMARVAALHSLGALVIDEIQDLSEAKSGGAARVLNFLVQLENTIGVPYLLIGTPKANQLFRGEFRQARRASEQGDINWQRMAQFADDPDEDKKLEIDSIWEEFIRALWTYQYVQTPSPLQMDIRDDSLSNALYDESQGITAVAVTLYVLAQRRAITSRKEKITAGIIRSVATDSQNQIRGYIEQIRQGAFVKSASNGETSDIGTAISSIASNNRDDDGQHAPLISSDQSDTESQSKVPDVTSRAELRTDKEQASACVKSDPNKKGGTVPKRPHDTHDLRNLASTKKGGNKSGRLQKKHIKSATEFLEPLKR
jgi:hypothetical protein